MKKYIIYFLLFAIIIYNSYSYAEPFKMLDDAKTFFNKNKRNIRHNINNKKEDFSNKMRSFLNKY